MIINIDGFEEREFYCKCNYNNCDKKMHLFVLKKQAERMRFVVGELHKLRIILKTHTGAHDVYIVVTSGARCTQHNSDIGGVVTSKHIQCRATDIYVIVNGERYTHEKLAKVIKLYDFILSVEYMEKTTHGEATHITWRTPC